MILEKILKSKRAEVAHAKTRVSEPELRARPLYAVARRGFLDRIQAGGLAIIAEIKKASPSKGLIRADFNPVVHAHQYTQAGARCLSVLTDGPFFQGSLADLVAVRGATALPLLRKDFMVDPYQVTEARAHGADAILLIVAALDDVQLKDLADLAGEEGLDVLVEVHDERELERALASGALFIGVNNRNLHTFETSLDTTTRLLALVPDGVTLVSESGYHSAAEIAGMEDIGVSAFLIGETLMRQADPGAALHALIAGAAGHALPKG
ncbi:MAG: indole-3-glycerol phosphate synthase TrpC [Candidatus Binatia bacterium]